MVKLIRWTKYVFLMFLPLVLVASVGWYFRTQSDFFLVEEVPLEIEYDESNVELAHGLRPLLLEKKSQWVGANIWSLSLNEIRRDFLAIDRIQDVEISRHFPNKINLLVRLNPIVFLYTDNRNQLFPITPRGTVMEVVQASHAPWAPILRNRKIVSSRDDLLKLIELYQQVPKINFLRADNIASVDFDNTTGLSIRLIQGDELIHLGQQDVATKGLQVVRVMDYLKSQKQKARVIDASFSKKVLVRLRKRS